MAAKKPARKSATTRKTSAKTPAKAPRQTPAASDASQPRLKTPIPRDGTVADRRLGADRRQLEAEAPTGLERRRSAGRRLSDFNRAAEEGELTSEQFLFLMAIEAFKKANETSFPTWTDVLEIVRLLGYRKTMASELTLRSAEDWREPANAPSGVRTERQIMRDRAAREAAGDFPELDREAA